MDITVSEKYLWFPVDMSGEMVWVSVYDGDQKIQEMKFPSEKSILILRGMEGDGVSWKRASDCQ